jgi:hypothetical protein
MDEYLTLYDVADLLHVPHRRVLRWAKHCEIPAVTLPDGDIVIPRDELTDWLRSRRTTPTAEVRQ